MIPSSAPASESLMFNNSLQILSSLEDLDFTFLGLCFVGVLALTLGAFKYIEAKRSPINSIPTIGHSGVLTSYLTAFKWVTAGHELIQEGYNRYPNGIFKVATIDKWMVVVTGRKHLDELRKAPDDVLSFQEAADETLQAKYTMGNIYTDSQRIMTLLTRNIAVKFDVIKDETTESFNTYIPITEVPAYGTLIHIVCRTSNRYLVGLPLCREQGYTSLQENFTTQVAVTSAIINIFPDFLKPIIGNSLTIVPKSIKLATSYLQPIIEERLDRKQRGNYEKPNDLIDWLLENAPEVCTVHYVVVRILAVNFAAIHTTTGACTHSLYDLAIHPEYLNEMRGEAETVIAAHGWTYSAMNHLHKIDSFLKESQRLHSLGYVQMFRKAVKDWTLSDGTVIPAGTSLSVASVPMHLEKSSFCEPDVFKGFRYSKLRNGDGELDSIKHQMVGLTLDTVVFGHGRHACPGRFFAVNLLKVIFTYCILNYDIQLEDGSMDRPPDQTFEGHLFPNMKAKLLFKKRSSHTNLNVSLMSK